MQTASNWDYLIKSMGKLAWLKKMYPAATGQEQDINKKKSGRTKNRRRK